MIPRNEAYWQDNEWKKLISSAISDPLKLLKMLNLSYKSLPYGLDLSVKFEQKVPLPFIQRMKKSDPYDPLLLQVLPLTIESKDVLGFVSDPLQEQETPIPGLLHKYESRVLVMLATTCAVNCRYCFRREFPYSENTPSKAGWPAIFEYLQNNPQINEVILSGGDPLAVNDRYFADFIKEVEKIEHIIRLRIHSRLPIVIPQRITQGLLNTFKNSRLQMVMVIHSNHPSELNDEVGQAMQLLRNNGVQLLNQSVLLKGINDNVAILQQLSEKLFAYGVQPYYLHLLDKVTGTAHFDVSKEDAINLAQQLQSKVSGFLMPKLAIEEPHKASKTLLPLS